MLRIIATIPNLLAMLMVLFTTVVPHHHHQAMICLIREVCVMDGCCNDEHTGHADADREDSETPCVAHEKYCPSDNLRLDGAAAVAAPLPAILPRPVAGTVPVFRTSCPEIFPPSPPPLLSWRRNC